MCRSDVHNTPWLYLFFFFWGISQISHKDAMVIGMQFDESIPTKNEASNFERYIKKTRHSFQGSIQALVTRKKHLLP